MLFDGRENGIRRSRERAHGSNLIALQSDLTGSVRFYDPRLKRQGGSERDDLLLRR